MAKNVIMPALGMSQDTGRIVRWLRAEGEQVTEGEPLLEIETDKATVELEAPCSGTLQGVKAGLGEAIPVGSVIAVIAGSEESGQQADRTVLSGNPSRGDAVPAQDRLRNSLAQLRSDAGDRPSRPLASPKAKRLAAERGIDLARFQGTGPGGAIVSADLRSSPAPVERVQPVEELVQSSVWKLTAERTTKTWTQVPHFYLSQQVNASRLVGWRDRAQPLVEGGVSYTDLIVKVVAAVLNRHPRLNSRWEDNRVVLNREVNLGIVVATDYGLVVPVIARAETLSLAAIAARRRDLVVRAHERKLRVEELQGGTFTLSNLGMYGVDSFFPIVNAPQAATLGVGRIADQVVVSNRQAVVQSCVTLTLSCDHRTVDGAAAATFLRDLASMMESPSADDCP